MNTLQHVKPYICLQQQNNLMPQRHASIYYQQESIYLLCRSHLQFSSAECKNIFCTCVSQYVVKHDARGKKGELSCCKCFFNQVKANLANIEPENLQNVQEMRFWQKVPGVNGLMLQNLGYALVLVDIWINIDTALYGLEGVCRVQTNLDSSFPF